MAALQAAQLDEGPADEARDRIVSAAWQHLASYGAMVQAVAERMSPEAVARTHHAAHQTIGALVKRGLFTWPAERTWTGRECRRPKRGSGSGARWRYRLKAFFMFLPASLSCSPT